MAYMALLLESSASVRHLSNPRPRPAPSLSPPPSAALSRGVLAELSDLGHALLARQRLMPAMKLAALRGVWEPATLLDLPNAYSFKRLLYDEVSNNNVLSMAEIKSVV